MFEELRAELECHLEKEEEVLFPACKDLEAGGGGYGHGLVGGAIGAMEDEHAAAGAALARLRELTNGYRPAAGACNSQRAMLDGLVTLEWDLHRHIHEENNILFPRAAALAQGGGAARQ